jgi:hypothetical protein
MLLKKVSLPFLKSQQTERKGLSRPRVVFTLQRHQPQGDILNTKTDTSDIRKCLHNCQYLIRKHPRDNKCQQWPTKVLQSWKRISAKNEDLLQGPLGIWKYFQCTRNWMSLLRLSIATLPREGARVIHVRPACGCVRTIWRLYRAALIHTYRTKHRKSAVRK